MTLCPLKIFIDTLIEYKNPAYKTYFDTLKAKIGWVFITKLAFQS